MTNRGKRPVRQGSGKGRRRALLPLALATSALTPQLALAQATPGSAQCPVVNNIVTCSGSLPDGVAVASGAFQGLTVSNVTGDMSAASRPVILYRTDQPNTAINLDDTDSTIRLTTTETTSGTPRLTGAVTATLTAPNTSFSLANNIDISILEQPGSVNATARDRPFGLLVEGSGGSFSLTNSGDITLTGVDFVTDSGGIGMAVSNADLVRVVNNGDISFVIGAGENNINGFGIAVEADNRRIEIENSGDISLPNGNAIYGIYVASDAVELTSTPGVVRPPSVRELESYRIVNSGTIATADRGIFVSDSQESIGTPAGEVINNGTIRSEFGIIVRHPGSKTVLNNGIIESRAPVGNEFITFFGIDVSGNAGEAPEAPDALVRVENAAGGILRSNLEFSRGVNAVSEPATIVNAGSIALTGAESLGIMSSTGGNFVGLTEIANTGSIEVTGTESRGIRTAVFSPGAGLVSDTRISSTGTIAATGADAFGIEYFSDGPQGLSRIDLGATSILRGGSGTGAAIRIVAGERHAITNGGLITAASGQAIIGGAGVETLDTSGRIEGSVALAGGNDGVTVRGGAVQLGALDGGADTDALLFDVAAGEASVTGPILNFEIVRKTGSGTLTLRDTGTISPGFALEAGTLLAEGSLGSTAIAAPGGTTLGGSGSVGAVSIVDGATLSPGGAGIGTLTVASLELSGNSRLLFDLGTPGSVGGADNDLLTVAGALRLDGVLDVNARPGFGNGVYRLIDYGGALTDNGLAIGNAPDREYTVQTAVAGQVNLVVAEDAGPGPTPPIQFWDGPDTAPDGTIDGGSGTWGGARTNWTRANGEVNEAWNGNFAVFQGAPGTVTIDPAGISATGLQFAVGGYTVQGGPLTLNAPATVRVGDASAGGSAMTATIASAIGGTGGLVKTDLGTLVLTGANGYTGGTTISSGILQVAADSALGGAGSGLTLDGGTLRLAGSITSGRSVTAGAGGGTIDTQSNNLTLSGPLQGAGTLTKSGSGTLVLTGASTGFTGRLATGTGGLRLDGSIGGTLEIGAGTTLSGTGTLGNLIVAGTLSPGNSVGTLTASGNAIFRAGSTFAVELTAAGASDRLNVTGTATIEGGTVAVTALDPELNYTDGTSYTFLSAAGGRTGTFAGLSESSAFLDFSLGYTATTAFLTVDVVLTFPEVAQTFNQVEAASALRELDLTAGSDSLAVYNAILLLDEAPARAAFNLASGEIYAAVMASSLRRSELAGDRFAARVHEAGRPGFGIWGAVSGHDGKVSGDGNGARFSHDGIGADLGIDYRGEGWTLGVGGGWSKGDVELKARLSSADWDGWHIGAYAGLGTGNSGFSATASALHMSGEADVRRAIAFGAISRTARAEVDTDTTALSLELRYGFPVGGGWAVGPAGSVGYADTDLDRFTEAGPSSLALSGNGSSESWTSYAVGGFANLRSERGSIDAALLYGRNDDRRAEADLALAGAPGQPFRVRASERGEDMAVLRLSGAYELGGGWTLGGNLRAATGSGEESISGQASLGLRF